MKRFILGALTALGGIGLYKLHKDGKIHIPVLNVRGTVNAVDYEARTFQIRSAIDRNILMDIAVSSDTRFMWLKPAAGAENTAQFADLTEGEKLHVAFFRNKENGLIVAERVVIENA